MENQGGTRHWVRCIRLLTHDPWDPGLEPHGHLRGPLDVFRPFFLVGEGNVVVLVLDLLTNGEEVNALTLNKATTGRGFFQGCLPAIE